MGTRLEGKVAVITGAAGGIGEETARLFAAEGAAVVIGDVAGEAAHRVAGEICGSGGRALASITDISSSGQVDEMFRSTETTFGGLDILVNNAFFNIRDHSIVELAEEDWDATIAVCLKGPFLCTRRALPMMKARGGGSVVTLSSVNALFGVSETAYTAAKGGLISMMRLVAAEYGGWNIRSNIICPGTVSTKTCMDYWGQYPAGFAQLRAQYPLGRIGTPRDIANLTLFLASEESAWITGAVQVIDGGLLSGRKLEVE
jgi:NAD(P)-dependent dehydrogenase (short-subunit alcohol dehydrogenase family)